MSREEANTFAVSYLSGILMSLLWKAGGVKFLRHPLCSGSASEAREGHNARTDPGFVRPESLDNLGCSIVKKKTHTIINLNI